MPLVLNIYAVVLLAVAALVFALVLVIRLRLPRAANAPAMNGPWPNVSIIVAAMNEAGTIEPALRSLLALDYPGLELIVVDDRSTDATGAILDRMAAEHAGRITALHVDRLPAGWLGKCHALHVAAAHARGEWLLFTDADVLFEPSAVRTAVAFASARRADHLVMFPRMLWKGYVEAALLSFFTMVFTIVYRIWMVESRSMRAFVGVGAFNMVRREVYDRFGGHEALRLEIADDLMLGLLVKRHGGRSTAVRAEDQVRVRWREGARDTVRGLERSGFAGIGFNIPMAIATVLLCAFVLLAPYALLPYLLAVGGAGTVAAWCTVGAITAVTATYALNGRVHGFPFWIGALHPLAVLLFAYAFARSAVLTSVHGGVRWRDTFYSIAELRRGRVR